MNTVLKNPTDQRLRAGWRILIFLLALIGISILLQFAVKFAIGEMPPKGVVRDFTLITIVAISASIAVPWISKKISKTDFVALGLQWNKTAKKDLIFGFVLSLMMMVVFFGSLITFGLIENITLNWHGLFSTDFMVMTLTSLLFMLFFDTIVGWWEEIVFRGFLLQNMIQGLGMTIAIIISCLLYGLIHMSNPNASLLSGSIIVLFGFLRIYGYLTTKMLWLSIGMHIGWNFFQGVIFGFAASGNTTPKLLTHDAAGPDLLTGGAFGPEASLLIIPIVFLTLYAMKKWSSFRA